MINKIRWHVTVALALVSAAALAGEPREISIPPGELAPALESLAKESGLLLIFQPSDLRGVWTQGVNGKLSPEEAVAKLISGTSLTLRVDATGAILITPEQNQASQLQGGNLARIAQVQTYRNETAGADVDPMTIETVNVFGTLENPLSVGSKSGQSLRETPKSVTVVTRERIEAQNLTSLSDVLSQTTGITVESFSAVDNRYISRGFSLKTVQRDGGAAGITDAFGAYLPADSVFFERVEVLRGVDGMFSGSGEPGGVINLVRKRAKATPEMQVNVTAGRWDFYRGELDVTGPLAQDGRLRGRFAGSYQDNGYFSEGAKAEKTSLLATGEYDLTPSTVLIAGVTYERRKEDGYYTGAPSYSNGPNLNLPRRTNLVPGWSHWYFTAKEAYLRAEQKFGDSGVLKLNLTRTEQVSDSRVVQPYGGVDPVTRTGALLWGAGSSMSSMQNLFDLSASGTFALFGREHRYTAGMDYAKVDAGGMIGYAPVGYEWPGVPIDVFNFDASSYPEPAWVRTWGIRVNQQSQNGFYGTLGFGLADSLRLTLGGRYGKYHFRDDTVRSNDSKFIPSVALSWNFIDGWSAYASYAETFVVQANLLKAPLPGSPLDPITGEGYELGMKGEVGALNASIALFRVSRKGEGATDPLYPWTPDLINGASCCYIQMNDVTNQGVDLELSGTVLPDWQLFAGYTFTDSKVEGERNAGTLYNITRTPKHLFKAWTTWRLPGPYSRWSLNAGVIAQSRVYADGEAYPIGSETPVEHRFSQGGYALWNAAVEYRLSESMSVALYGENLLDKTYYRTTNGDIARYHVYGTPRNLVLTFRARW